MNDDDGDVAFLSFCTESLNTPALYTFKYTSVAKYTCHVQRFTKILSLFQHLLYMALLNDFMLNSVPQSNTCYCG